MAITNRIRKMAFLALADADFFPAMLKAEEKPVDSEMFNDDLGKHLLAMCYWGWHLAKGTTNELKSKLPKQ